MIISADEVGFDLDGVIANTAEAFLRIACTKHGYCSYTAEDISNFELIDCIDIPQPIIESIFDDIQKDSLATGLIPIVGAVKTLNALACENSITIITARSFKTPVLDWIDNFFPAQTRDAIKVIVTGDHNDKIRHIHKNKLRFFIDDRAETCLQLTQAGITPFVYSQPWNRHRHSLQTVENWDEIHTLLGKP